MATFHSGSEGQTQKPFAGKAGRKTSTPSAADRSTWHSAQ